MYSNFYFSSSFWQSIYKIDEEIGKNFQSKGCPDCGGSLHSAKYPRKVRGIPSDCEELFALRISFCCSRCRKRATPGSVRFLGRRVYGSLFIVLVSSFGREGLGAYDLLNLSTSFASITFKRWYHWWAEVIPVSNVWRELQGFLQAEIQKSFLPTRLIIEFWSIQISARAAMKSLLRFLSPMSEPSKYPPSDRFISWL